ncbi:MAG: glycosyltransferase, partial [Planctomycetota bacterium]
SIANQTWPHIDCIIVDPQSPDDTAAVAQQLADSYPDRKLRLLKHRNRGLSASRNAGIQNTTAPLILPLDADDLLKPEAVERMVRPFLDDEGLSVVHSAGREFGDGHQPMPAQEITKEIQLHKNQIACCSMFTRCAWQRVGGYNENMLHGYEDWDFWVGMLEHGLRFHAVPDELWLYRKHGRSMIDDAQEKDIWLRSRIILNHPDLYHPEHVALATEVLDLGNEEPDLQLRVRIARFYTEVNCPEHGVPHCRILLGERGADLDGAALACVSFMLGYGLLALEQPTEATPHLQRAVDLEPSKAQYLRALALAMFWGGKPQEALPWLERAIWLEPESQESQRLVKKMRQAVS